MALAEALSGRLWVELWTSFASLLRSYTAAHGLNGPEQAVVEVSANEILVRVEDRWLRVSEKQQTVTWTREDGSTGQFTFSEDGRIKSEGVEEEMDMVAERLAREIMR